jgi:hypothetical protein
MAASYMPLMAAVSAKAQSSSTHSVEIREQFTLLSLDDSAGHLTTGKVIQLTGQRLIAQVSEPLKPDTCVKIGCEDAFVLGEILGCWRDQSETFAAVKLLQELSGLEELAEICGEPRESSQTLKV